MGRKPREPVLVNGMKYHDDSMDFLLEAMNNPEVDFKDRLTAANHLLKIQHPVQRIQAYKGKKEVEQEQAVYVQSKFSTFQAPPGTKK